MQDFCNQLNGSAAVGSEVWNENKGIRKDPDSSQFLQNQFSISEASTGAVSTPHSIPSSVIFSSNYCGVKGATDNFDNASSLIYNTAHLDDSLSSSSQASVPAEAASHGVGASIVRRGLNLDYDSSQHSNSQSAQFSPIAGQSHFASSPNERVDSPAMWNVANSCEGTQGSSSSVNKSLNQIPHQGAKSTHSDTRAGNSSLQQAPTVSESLKDYHSNTSDMQSNVQKKMESNSRYNNNDATSSSHSTNSSAGFISNNGNNAYRNSIGNGVHSNNNLQLLNIGANNESNSQNSSFGAPYNNSMNSRAKTQSGNCESNSAFTGWQGLNTSTTSVPASNGWLIPNSLSSRNAHDVSSNSKEGVPKDGDENMVVDNEMSYSDLIGSTGGTENGEEKQQIANGGQGNMSWGMPSRLGLLGSGENSMNPGTNVWNNTQGPVTSSGSNAWDNNRQNNAAPNSQEESPEMMDSQSGYSRLIGAIGGSEYADGKQENSGNFKQNASRPLPPRLGLLGGGESSLNTASSGWGGSGTSGTNSSGWVGGGPRSNNGSSDMSGNNSSGMSPPKPHNSWAQAAGKGLAQPQPTSSGSNAHNIPSNPETRVSTTDSPSAAKSPSEVITEIKVKAAVSEGWGQTPINQDAPWDLPPSPPLPVDPSAMKDPPPPVFRAPVNNGTEIWENNLRMNKGAPAPVTSTAPPWGHTPATNIGGHWGDDDSSNNMWSSAPPPNVGGNSNWAEANTNVPNAMWGNPNPPPPSEKHWGGSGGNGNGQGGASWNEPMVGGENGSSVWNPPVAKQRNVGNWSPASTPKKEMPPSGWELPSPPTNRRPPVTNYDDGTSVWGNPQRQGKVSHWKDMPSAKPIMNTGNNVGNPAVMSSMGGGGMQPPGPGMIRLPSGASKNEMWGKSSMNRNPGWQEGPSHDGPNIGTWGEDNMHMGNSMKNAPGNANVGGGPFGGGGNNWGEQQNNSMSGYWGNNKSKNNSSWADGQVDTSSWLGPSKQGGKPLTRDLIWASKQFRLLIEMGCKKEDAENALRNNNMNYEDALVELRTSAAMDGSMMDVDGFHGRKVRPANLQDDMSMSDNVLDINFPGGNFHGSGFQSGGNFQGMGNVGAFKPQIKGSNNASSLLNNTLGGPQSTVGSMGNFPPLFQKLLQQQPQSTQNNMQQFASNVQQLSSQSSRGGGVGGNNFPSTAQLRHLVQQIQMAVHAGHLNPQILNQPLAPQTLLLLYQLLQQIKVLHQLQNAPKSAMGSGLQLNVQITQTKQRIINLQNQINAQQAVFLKQQVPIQSTQLHVPQSSMDIYKPNMESMPALHNDFRDLSIKDVPLQGHQQSRLNQWKLPSYEKDENQLCISSNDFSRAPGPMPSKTSSASSSGPNLHPLLSQGDSAWSSLSRPQTESGWPEPTAPLTGLSDNSTGSSNVPVSAPMPSGLGIGSGSSNTNSGSLETKEPSTTPPSSGPSTSSASHSSYNLTDLVPEFEPGKPWKGTQLKNIEDDPHITPGSIARSPLSVNTIKDTDLFWNSKSNSTATSGGNDSAGGSLVSNTWIFSQPNANNSSGKSGNSKSNWSTNDSNTGSDMWGSKPRGPPPGISSQGWEKHGNSTFLLLRNLTPQIDGSTLRTLCMQHGPLNMFHLSLNHGIALVRYSTKEEVSKAQSALNNCVLGNTTILADIPNDGEIQQYLVLLCNQNTPGGYFPWSGSQQGSNGNSSGGNNTTGVRANNSATMSTYPFGLPSGSSANGAAKQPDSTSWSGNNLNMPSQLWPISNASSALWGMPQPMSDHESSTNSSLNRFLPDDLLGGESM